MYARATGVSAVCNRLLTPDQHKLSVAVADQLLIPGDQGQL